MLASSRTVYGREFRVTPKWLWVLQRASGLLLGPLVALHVLVPGMASQRWLSVLLLAIVIGHGYSGVRRMQVTAGKAGLYAALALAWCVIVGVLGAWIIVAGA